MNARTFSQIIRSLVEAIQPPKKVIMGLGVLALSSVASAAIASTCAQFYCKGQISLLYTNISGNVAVNLAGGLTGLTDCTLWGGIYFTLDMTQPNAKYVYAQLLAAQVAGTNVEIVAQQYSSDCHIIYVTSPPGF